MRRENDPRFWGTVAVSGGVSTSDPLVLAAQKVRGKVASGAKSIQDPRTHKFANPNKLLANLIHIVGVRMIRH